ncbi:hypothetical protein AB1E18_001339 [Capra hircus]
MQSSSFSGRGAGGGSGPPDPYSLRGPRLTQCAGGPGRSAPALQPRSDIHRRSQSAAPAAAPALPRPAREHPRKAGGGCGEERARGPGLRAASERARAPRRYRHRTRPAVRPPTRGEDDPPVATARGPSSVLGGEGEGEALRCERGAPPQRPPQRRAKPRPAPLWGLGRLRFRLAQVASTGPFATFPARPPSRRCRCFRFTRAGAAGPRRGEDGGKAADADAPRDARAAVTLLPLPRPGRLSGLPRPTAPLPRRAGTPAARPGPLPL